MASHWLIITGMELKTWTSQERGRSLALAKYLQISPPVISDWCAGKKQIAAEHCKAIERFTEGAVTCQEMRPNDWVKYWPELAATPIPGHQPATQIQEVSHAAS